MLLLAHTYCPYDLFESNITTGCDALLKWKGEVAPNSSLFMHTIQFHEVRHATLKELVISSQHSQNSVELAHLKSFVPWKQSPVLFSGI